MKPRGYSMSMRACAAFVSIAVAVSSCQKNNVREEASLASGNVSNAQESAASVAATSSLFICSPGGEMYRYNAATGSIIWRKKLSGDGESTPCYANGLVYINTGDTTYALKTGNGSIVWRQRTGHVTGALLVNNQKIYVNTDSSVIYCMNAANGTTVWRKQFGVAAVGSFTKQSSPTIQNGVLYIGGTDVTLYAVDAATGNLKWKHAEPGRSGIHSSPCVNGNKVYVTYDYGMVAAYNATTGKQLWLQKTTPSADRSPGINGGRLYQSSQKLTCFDAATGAVNWEFKDTVKGASTGSDAFADDTKVYVSCGTYRYALDKVAGRIVWLNTAFGNDSYNLSPVAADGFVYFVGFASRSIDAIDTETGKTVWYGGLSSSQFSYYTKGSPIIVKANGEAVYPVISGMRQ